MNPLNKWVKSALFGILCSLSSACTHHVVAPPVPAPQIAKSQALEGQSWKLASIKFTGQTGKDRLKDLKKLEHRFKGYLQSHFELGPESKDSDLTFELALNVRRKHYRTVVMDLVNLPFAPFLIGGFFNPEWGSVKVAGSLRIYDRDNVLQTEHIAMAEEDFSMFIYSWYRAGPIEDALKLSYAQIFKNMMLDISRKKRIHHAERTRTKQLKAPGDLFIGDAAQTDTFLKDPAARPLSSYPPPPLPAQPTKLTQSVTLKEKVKNDKNRFRIIYEPEPIVYESFLLKGLAALGGVEGAYFTGRATVTSSIKQEDGNYVEVANGKALHQGYRVTLYDAPKTTGFYWYPVVGFLDQSIDITDFYENVPQIGTDIGTDIGADCTLIEDGVPTPIPCGLPNTYRLEMQSIVAGLRMGFSVVAGTPNVQLFFSGTAGSNMMEWRSIAASLGTLKQGKREKFEFIQSAALGSTVGIVFPKLHLSMRAMFNYEVYQSFEFDSPIEFMGPTVCDMTINRCERQRAFVESTSLSSWTMQFAAGVTF
jgi:hypothetical protein